ncbi:MAG: ParB N-terminal domain-containing protein [Clostridium sp.]|nr:ParB N-terminal domain-containing protein [Clostridium sp.]
MTTLTLSEILTIDMINAVDEEKVNDLMESIRVKGYVGAPLFVHAGINQLVTGSHRLEALKRLAEENEDLYDTEVAIDVSEMVDEALTRDGRTYAEIDYSDIGWMFEGTELEQFESETEEW